MLACFLLVAHTTVPDTQELATWDWNGYSVKAEHDQNSHVRSVQKPRKALASESGVSLSELRAKTGIKQRPSLEEIKRRMRLSLLQSEPASKQSRRSEIKAHEAKLESLDRRLRRKIAQLKSELAGPRNARPNRRREAPERKVVANHNQVSKNLT